MGQNDTINGIETARLPPEATSSNGLPRTRTILIDQEQFRAYLARYCARRGAQSELARSLNISGQFISNIIAGKKHPGRKLLAALGARPKSMIEIDVEIRKEGGNGE